MRVAQEMKEILKWWVDEDTFALHSFGDTYIVLANIHYGSTPITLMFDENETKAIKTLLEIKESVGGMDIDELLQNWIWRASMDVR